MGTIRFSEFNGSHLGFRQVQTSNPFTAYTCLYYAIILHLLYILIYQWQVSYWMSAQCLSHGLTVRSLNGMLECSTN